MIYFLLVFFICFNIIGYITMYVDKRKAKKQQWRIPEKRLWILACLGGSLGLIIGMKQFRHKTKHFSFKYGLPVFFIFNIVIYSWFTTLLLR